MVNWVYTLWERHYDGKGFVFVSSVHRGPGQGSGQEGTLEGLAQHHYEHRLSGPGPTGNDLTFDESDWIKTIPTIVRKKGQYVDRPASLSQILEFERVLDKKFNDKPE